MDMVGKVRRMRLRAQLSISEIAKRTRLARNTVKKWLNAAGDKLPRYRRAKGRLRNHAIEHEAEGDVIALPVRFA